MDAQIPITGLIEEFEALMESGDFEGAEEVLASALGAQPKLEAFLQYQYGRLYGRWNKLSSAIHHLNRAVEVAKLNGDEIFVIQVLSEMKSAKDRQAAQKP